MCISTGCQSEGSNTISAGLKGQRSQWLDTGQNSISVYKTGKKGGALMKSAGRGRGVLSGTFALSLPPPPRETKGPLANAVCNPFCRLANRGPEQ